jgi:hypothetical protein
MIRPLKPLSFFVSQVTCEMRREGFGSAKPASAIAAAGTVEPSGKRRSKGNPRMRFLSQKRPRNSIEFGNNLAERIKPRDSIRVPPSVCCPLLSAGFKK